MFEDLSKKLESAFKTLKGQGRISEINVAETSKEVRRALLDADVNYKIAKDFTDRVREKALGQNVLTAVSPGQLFTKIINDELTSLLGGEAAEMKLSGNPAVILIAGLQGSGKTTFTGKLGKYYLSKGKKPLLAACDVYRPAAINQLQVLGEQEGIEVFADLEDKNPVNIAKRAIEQAKRAGNSIVIVDTAGRLSIDEQMMQEIAAIKKEIQPSEILLVVDAMTGQDAVTTAENFNNVLDITGVVLSKLDGDTRGGAALSIKTIVQKPIKFVSHGEKLDALDVFHPDRMASRILGMGDIVSLVEKAQFNFDEEESARLRKKMAKNKFDLDDFLSQLQQIKKMGNIKDLMGMIPGVGNKIRDLDVDNDSFKSIEAIIQSMTSAERGQPDIINGSRRARIAKGSGTNIQEVNKLLKQFADMRKMMKMMNKGNLGKMMKGG